MKPAKTIEQLNAECRAAADPRIIEMRDILDNYASGRVGHLRTLFLLEERIYDLRTSSHSVYCEFLDILKKGDL